MIARAPGKVVLSGAYAVLEGAPAIVAAVDRYVIADSDRAADVTTPEVLEALARRRDASGPPPHPWFDAAALRSGGDQDHKLGLGSSAAILVACLASLELASEPGQDDESLAEATFRPALAAHRAAQGGGSGIDVAASAFGGFQLCRGAPHDLVVERIALPSPLTIEVWSSPTPSSTRDMLRKVGALRERDATRYAAHIAELSRAAEEAASAQDACAFVAACRAQLEGLERLGRSADAPIVTRAILDFDAAARPRDGVVLPSGAGGGDVALWVGLGPPDDAARAAGAAAGFDRLEVALGARGVHSTRGALQRDGTRPDGREEGHDDP